MITKIELTNFKSFKQLNIDLSNFNVIIGPNASGKSNFVQIFRFLKDIKQSGLENAVSLQGGIEYLTNMHLRHELEFSLLLESDDNFGFVRNVKNKFYGIDIIQLQYQFSLKFFPRKKTFKITKDKFHFKCNFEIFENSHKKKKILRKIDNLGTGFIDIENNNGKININLNKPNLIPLQKQHLLPSFFWQNKIPDNLLLLEFPFFFTPEINEVFTSINIFDFDPKLPKKATPISGKIELEEDASNLAIILKNLLSDKEKKRKLFNLIKEILPYIHNLEVEKFADKSLLFKVQEEFLSNQYIPASAISDGTINIIALILALYFETKKITIIEEPERNIHPYLISKLIELMKDASKAKQIILTTHNAEFVKHADLENLFFCKRDADGFSTIIKPEDNKDIKTFLKNEIGIDDLFVQNLLDI